MGSPTGTERLVLADRAATTALAGRLAAGLRAGDVLALTGPLGAGKTTLVRALVAALTGDPSDVVSPTFALVQHYAARLPVAHVDAYRIGSVQEFRALGWEEIFPTDAAGAPCGVTVVEWADRVAAAIPPEAVWLDLAPGAGERREATASGPTEALARLGLAGGP